MAADVDWDEALRALLGSTPTGGHPPLEATAPAWVTLEEAEAATGASRSTLRAWYRAGEIPSTMVEGAHGPQRLVDLEAVMARAQRSPRLRKKLEASETGAEPGRSEPSLTGFSLPGEPAAADVTAELLERLVAHLVDEAGSRARAEADAAALRRELAGLRQELDELRRRLGELEGQ